MSKMGFAGFRRGDAITATVSQGAADASNSVTAWQRPAKALIPFISGVYRLGETLTADVAHLTSPTDIRWFRTDAPETIIATGATFVPSVMMAEMGKRLAIIVDVDGEDMTSPSIGFLHDHASARMNNEIDAMMGLVPHSLTTHMAVVDGDWTDPETWHNGEVPDKGAVVLIPHGRSVVYDEDRENIQLSLVRVDGTLAHSVTETTRIYCSTRLTTPGGQITMGTVSSPMPEEHQAIFTVATQDYELSVQDGPGKIDFSRDVELIGRGEVNLGSRETCGATKTPFVMCQWGMAPLIGASSVTVQGNWTDGGPPEGWAVGDIIHVPHTAPFDSVFDGRQLSQQGEERVITSITDNLDGTITVAFADALIYNHDHHNSSILRRDLVPCIANLTRNVIYRSEAPRPWKYRGHVIDAHGATVITHYTSYIDLGRTIKNEPIGAVADDDGDLVFSGKIESSFSTRELLEDDNVIGRYPWHPHHCEFDALGCVMWGSPSWGASHHSAFGKLHYCIAIDCMGAGFVTEQGNETGSWLGLYISCLPQNTNGLLSKFDLDIKGGNSSEFLFGSHANGMFMRARQPSVVRCHVYGGAVGLAMGHRASPDPSPRLSLDPSVQALEIADFNLAGHLNYTYDSKHWPILNHFENEFVGCISAFESVKNEQRQWNSVYSHIKRSKGWAIRRGVMPKYVMRYLFDECDMTAPLDGGEWGLGHVGNISNVTYVNCRVEGFNVGVASNSRDDAGGSPPEGAAHFDAIDNPWRAFINLEIVDCVQGIVTGVSFRPENAALDVETVQAMLQDEPRPDLIEADLVMPSRMVGSATFAPAAAGTYTPPFLYDTLAELTGATDGLSFPQTFDDGNMRSDQDFQGPRNIVVKYGYHQVGGVSAAINNVLFADRVSGRLHKKACGYDIAGSDLSGQTDNGAFVFSSDKPVLADANPVYSTAVGTPITINVLTGVTHGGDGGVTLADIYLDSDHRRPNLGELEFDFETGDVTYTPFLQERGVDTFELLVGDGHGNWTPCFVSVEVGCAAPQDYASGQFDIEAGGAGEIVFKLLKAPAQGHRFIQEQHYSTDNGATWARLSLFRVLSDFTITTGSDGSPLSAGTYQCRIRYKADAANPTAGTTAIPITVT